MTKSQLAAQRRTLDRQLQAIEKQLAALERQEDALASVESGESPSPEQAKRIAAQAHSYGVTFVRRKANKRGELVKHSARRFSSRKEAEQHGKRFATKHRHAEFSICIVQKKANAWVNWKTGKTNPVL